MDIKDILVVLESYPKSTSVKAIEGAARFAQIVGARLSALAVPLNYSVRTPAIGNFFGINNRIRAMMAAENEKSISNADHLLKVFEKLALEKGIFSQKTTKVATQYDLPLRVVDDARFYDLTIVPAGGGQEFATAILEELIFSSGRPVIILPEKGKGPLRASLGNVAIAWDFSRAATRAVSDAIPLLQRAKHVRIFTVMNEKKIFTRSSLGQLAKYLARHGIKATQDKVFPRSKSIAEAFKSYVATHNIDLLVMGAYGHSPVKEFVLGGATKSVIEKPFQWTFLSH